VRLKQQDRGTYRSPQIDSRGEEKPSPASPSPKTPKTLVPPVEQGVQPASYQAHEAPGLVELPPGAPVEWGDEWDASCGVEPGCGIAPLCDCVGEHSCGVEGPLVCDSVLGCSRCGGADACAGCGGCGSCGDCRCPPLVFCDPDRWFGKAELLLWWRDKTRLPPLVSNTSDSAEVFDTASLLYGNLNVADDLTAGGRFQAGMWLDPQHCQAVVGRLWGLGEESYGYATNSGENPTIVRPFRDANGDPTALVIAGDGRTGTLSINGDSQVYGADISLRQLWRKGLGGRIDFLCGYQHVRINESLQISSLTTDAPPNQARTIERTDLFDIDNEFHGGQVGFAGRFREGCWSWDGMFKLGFGSLRRGANLSGMTVTEDDRLDPPDDRFSDPVGLLVRQSNRGDEDDSTFAWVPELNLNLVYHTHHNVDLSVGYGLVVVTDALQVSGAIDEDLQVDLGQPPTVDRPNRGFRYDDYWVQGIQFGLDWWY